MASEPREGTGGNGETTPRDPRPPKLLPPGYLLLAILLMLLFHFLVPLTRLLPLTLRLVGLFPLLIGVALNLLADRAFQRANTTVKPHLEPTTLLEGGVHGVSRHPMYLGMALILLGLALLLGSLSPWLIVFAFPLLLEVVFIRHEEGVMEATFGEEYRRYRQRVRRWI